MPAHCPVSCPCRRAGDGVFLFTISAYAALWARVYLGGDFGSLLIALLRAPRNPPFLLVVWAAFAFAALVLIGVGLRATLIGNEDVPVRSWLIAATICAALLGWCWSLPGAWMLTARGFCIATIAAAAANACLALRLTIWESGYWVGRASTEYGEPDRRHADAIASLTAERDRLAGELAKVSASPGELAAFVEILGGRRKVLAWLHPDRAQGEAAKQAATMRFQKAASMLNRIGKG